MRTLSSALVPSTHQEQHAIDARVTKWPCTMASHNELAQLVVDRVGKAYSELCGEDEKLYLVELVAVASNFHLQ
jgi:hypothetical protein